MAHVVACLPSMHGAQDLTPSGLVVMVGKLGMGHTGVSVAAFLKFL